LTFLTERGWFARWGLGGGEPGTKGRNAVLRAGVGAQGLGPLPSKVQLKLEAGDRLTIETPGGAGWGEATG